MPVQLHCDPASVLAESGCLKCLSLSELNMVLLYLWAILEGYTLPADLDKLLEDSVCNNCVSGPTKEREQEVMAMADAILSERETPTSVIEALKCVRCLKPDQIESALTFLKCKFWKTQLPE